MQQPTNEITEGIDHGRAHGCFRAGLPTNRAVELYDLATNVGERTDLAQQERRKCDELLGDLIARPDETKASLPRKP